jgi:phosphatidylserine decarboxylase
MTFTDGRLKLARGASPWLVPVLTVTAAAVVRSRRSRRWARVVPPLATLSGLMLWFFRDPERQPAEGLVLSPADGVVQSIDPWPDGRTRVAIFMNPLNVHVNRAPCAGTVASVQHIPGGYLPAFDKESDRNERVVWHLDTAIGDLEVTQIAGAVARRIVPYADAGQAVGRGERIGLIRFGSRVDVYLPVDLTPTVAVRQRTLAARTPLA